MFCLLLFFDPLRNVHAGDDDSADSAIAGRPGPHTQATHRTAPSARRNRSNSQLSVAPARQRR